jgi:hypothetical protein
VLILSNFMERICVAYAYSTSSYEKSQLSIKVCGFCISKTQRCFSKCMIKMDKFHNGINEKNVVYIHNGVLLRQQQE